MRLCNPRHSLRQKHAWMKIKCVRMSQSCFIKNVPFIPQGALKLKLSYFQSFYESWKPSWLLIFRNLVLTRNIFRVFFFRISMFLLVSTWKWNKNAVPRGNIWETPCGFKQVLWCFGAVSDFQKFRLGSLAAFAGLIKGLESPDLHLTGPCLGRARGNAHPALLLQLL